MTRVFLPNHYLSDTIARALTIEYYKMPAGTHPTIVMAQRRVCDYIVEIDRRGSNFILAATSNGAIHEFETIDDLTTYLNNC